MVDSCPRHQSPANMSLKFDLKLLLFRQTLVADLAARELWVLKDRRHRVGDKKINKYICMQQEPRTTFQYTTPTIYLSARNAHFFLRGLPYFNETTGVDDFDLM